MIIPGKKILLLIHKIKIISCPSNWPCLRPLGGQAIHFYVRMALFKYVGSKKVRMQNFSNFLMAAKGAQILSKSGGKLVKSIADHKIPRLIFIHVQ